jgi:cholinesterase
VTIWGESAGAGSVLQHLIANGGNTQPALFRAAITSSTFLPSQYEFNDRIPEARHYVHCRLLKNGADDHSLHRFFTPNLFHRASREHDWMIKNIFIYAFSYLDNSCSTSTDTLACLREVDVNTLQAANVNICNSVFFGTFAFVPVVDGTLITERPTQLLKQGKVNGVSCNYTTTEPDKF